MSKQSVGRASVLPQMQGCACCEPAAMNINIDGAPILGEAPRKYPLIQRGHLEWLYLSPVVARMTVDLLLGRSTLFDPQPFSIHRFQH